MDRRPPHSPECNLTSSGLSRFQPGNHSLTRLVKQLSREQNTAFWPVFTSSVFGRKVSAYVCDDVVLKRALRQLESQEGSKKAREKARSSNDQRRRACQGMSRTAFVEKWKELKTRYGWTMAVPSGWVDQSGPALLTEPTPELYTAEQWCKMGYEVHGKARSLLIRPGNPVPLYSWEQATARTQPGRSPDELWPAWHGEFTSELLAVGKALHAVGKLMGLIPDAHVWNREVDAIKATIISRWLSSSFISGRIVQTRTVLCCNCHGFGCGSCDETGFALEATLYEHRFRVDGNEFAIESAAQPSKINPEPAASPSETPCWTNDELPGITFQELVALLRWVATQNPQL